MNKRISKTLSRSPLDCNNNRTFWISWYDSVLAVGQGMERKKQQAFKTDFSLDPFKVHGVIFSTKSKDGALWRILDYCGM